MAEYINREELLKDINDSVRFSTRNGVSAELRGAHKITDRIRSATACDVVEVVHGEWVQTKEPLGANEVDCVECSVCRESWIIEEDLSLDEYIEFWHYCPNCGAEMDGERRSENENT